MKKLMTALLLCVILAPARAQSPSVAADDERSGVEQIRTAHYLILCDDGDAQDTANEMEERFAVYNRLFRFDSKPPFLSGTGVPMTVRVFYDAEAYNEYVGSRLGSSRQGAVYLHYSQIGRRELVINRGGDEENSALPYQAFIQFLRAFVSNPPAWMREGFAVFFSGLRYTHGVLRYDEQLDWLETIKDMPAPPSVEEILTADSSGLPEDFPALAWSVVSFFLNSGNGEYIRTLTDCFMLLSDDKTDAENAEMIMQMIERWNNMETLATDYRQYLNSRKTFTWLMDEGQRAYAVQDYTGAELAFLAAKNQQPSHFAPWYYLGLLAYDENNFETAEQYYLASLKLGADPALTAYALGLNAAGAGNRTEAEKYLREAVRIAPDRYREKAETILSRLK
jgi:tetratricopeptide (TPR) repeat protein